MPQLPAVNQRVQTGVYKHERYHILMQDFKILSSDFMVANLVNIFGK